jgi:hypothetical protein
MLRFAYFVDSQLTVGGEFSLMQLEGLGELKNPVTSSRIEPAAFRLVA